MKVPRGAEEDGVEEAFFLEEPMRTVSTVGALLLFACSGAQKPATGDDARSRAQTVVSAPDRTPEDRALDGGRKPAETLEFLRLQPGMKVAELGAGAGGSRQRNGATAAALRRRSSPERIPLTGLGRALRKKEERREMKLTAEAPGDNEVRREVRCG